MKDFLSSFSSIKSLNSSSIGWNNSLMVSAMPSVECCPSLELLIISSIFFYYFVYHFCFGSVNRSFLFPAVLSWPCSLLDIFYPFFPGGLRKKLELVSLFCLKFLNFYVLYLVEHTRIVSLELSYPLWQDFIAWNLYRIVNTLIKWNMRYRSIGIVIPFIRRSRSDFYRHCK